MAFGGRPDSVSSVVISAKAPGFETPGFETPGFER